MRTALALPLALAGCSAQNARLRPVAADLRAPETARRDGTRGVWFVSCFGQASDLSGATPDAPGYVSRLAADGTVLDERLVELGGDLLGLAVLDGTLNASLGNDLLAIDV